MAALTDLRSIAPDERIPILDQQLRLLAEATKAAMGDERDAGMALDADQRGLGHAAGRDLP